MVMAQLSRSTSQYRDGVFSAASPAPRYGSMTRPFENGSLGDDMTLESDACAILDPALDHLVASLQPGGLESRALPPAALAAAQIAIALAQAARAESDIQKKLVLAMAASYSAAFFGLPRNTLLYTIEQICGMFAMSSSQRRQYHQQAAALLDQYVATLKKGNNSMSGVYKDGVLGNAMFQNGAVRDGSLGRQNGAFHDGSLGAVFQNTAFHDGSLGTTRKVGRRHYASRKPAVWSRSVKGLGGCGCSGIGADVAVVDETPFYKKPLYIGGAALVLGVVLYKFAK